MNEPPHSLQVICWSLIVISSSPYVRAPRSATYRRPVKRGASPGTRKVGDDDHGILGQSTLNGSVGRRLVHCYLYCSLSCPC
jgi:hypothetical protein